LGRKQLRERTSTTSQQKARHSVIELDARENKILKLALLEMQGRLMEAQGDTTLSPARRRRAMSELLAIASLLEKTRVRLGST
jgi:hypothetical protein